MGDQNKLQKYCDYVIKKMIDHYRTSATGHCKNENLGAFRAHGEDLSKLVESFPELKLSPDARRYLDFL